MVCQRCGKVNNENNLYCEKCGRKLGSELTQDELELLELSKRNEQMIEELCSMSENKKTSTWKNTLIWFIASIILGALCFACMWGVSFLGNM